MTVGDTIQFRLDGSTAAWQFGTLATHTDGAPYVAIALPSGGYASLTPGGAWQPPASSTGAWERFIPSGSALLAAPRQGGPGGVVDAVNTSGKNE